MSKNLNENSHDGHRRRLRQRFKKTGLEGFHDYEFVELLLTYAIPQRDVKPIAKELIQHFGGIKGVFDASIEELASVKGIGERSAILIKLLKDGATLYLKTRIKSKEVLSSPQDVFNFCRYALSGERNEKFTVIYLTTKNEVIEVETLDEGTINRTAVYPRKVIEGAIRHNASALIFVHNHPSGDPTPSITDRRLTEDLEKAASTVDITVHDHIIIGKDSHFSGRENGWLSSKGLPSSGQVAEQKRLW
ncbi:MAG: DNA repair protein RadC [Deltaproteobacteria bacterium]|nr:DNA repair protein RadC [Deltaproteobacteria bacterium]